MFPISNIAPQDMRDETCWGVTVATVMPSFTAANNISLYNGTCWSKFGSASRSCHAQAYGLSQPQYTIGGTLTGVAGDYWDVLWPHSTNAVSVGFLVLSRSPQQLQPSKVTAGWAHTFLLADGLWAYCNFLPSTKSRGGAVLQLSVESHCTLCICTFPG